MATKRSSIKSKINTEKKVAPVGYMEKLETEVQSNQSKVSLVLGALIVLVVGILIFNYFSASKASLGPAQQTNQEISQQTAAVKYTVKEGDTLFTIAEKYYLDGEKFSDIANANKLADANQIEVGQVLELRKTETPQAQDTLGTGGGNSTIWGDKIEGNTYTVTADDWLSKIAGRVYGDVLAFDKIAKANNITNPDLIEPGTVLTIPR